MRLLHRGNQLEATCYRLSSEVLLCTCDASRDLLTNPVLTGVPYQSLLREAAGRALRAVLAGDDRLARDAASGVDVVTVLRGGLAFDMPAAAHAAGLPMATVSFVGTRRPAAPGRPVEIDYERWELDGGLIVIGDIVATGGTIRGLLTQLRRAADDRRIRPARVLLVTITAADGVRAVLEASAEFRWPTTVVVLESLFSLPSAATSPLGISQHPFDLLRSGQVGTPEFERTRLLRPQSIFEKCAVYDGGMRTFHPSEHVDLRRGWWAEVAARGPALGLADLGRVLAGLDQYERDFAEWRASASWAGAGTADLDEEIFDLGRRVLSLTRDIPLRTYFADWVQSDRLG